MAAVAAAGNNTVIRSEVPFHPGGDDDELASRRRGRGAPRAVRHRAGDPHLQIRPPVIRCFAARAATCAAPPGQRAAPVDRRDFARAPPDGRAQHRTSSPRPIRAACVPGAGFRRTPARTATVVERPSPNSPTPRNVSLHGPIRRTRSGVCRARRAPLPSFALSRVWSTSITSAGAAERTASHTARSARRYWRGPQKWTRTNADRCSERRFDAPGCHHRHRARDHDRNCRPVGGSPARPRGAPHGQAGAIERVRTRACPAAFGSAPACGATWRPAVRAAEISR